VRSQIEFVAEDSRIRRAFRYISQKEAEIEGDQIRLTLIPAPPFQENARAQAFSNELRQMDVRPTTDVVGNVVGAYEDIGRNPVVIAAHLDTVFPASTPLQLRRKANTLFLPGIADNGAGIVALLWAFRAAKEAGIRFRRPVIAVGTVGEEGEGNLRGVRCLFERPPWGDRNCEFIAVDGGGLHRITNRALGSRRFRVVMQGPGGHSWADFGHPNPIQSLATAIHTFSNGGAARRPGSSFIFGIIRGGISVNAIPSEASMEVDLRSVDAADLDGLDYQLKRIVADSARAAGVAFHIEKTGDRPSGATPPQSTIVQAALEASRAIGVEAQVDVGSTDANIPISLGIPAIAIGGGGLSGSIHTAEEWFDSADRYLGIQRLLTTVAALAGII